MQTIRFFAFDYGPGETIGAHRHEHAQLVAAIAGSMNVVAAGRSWTVTTARALWIPPGVKHEIWMLGSVRMRSLYFDPAAVRMLPDRVVSLQASPVVHAAWRRFLEVESDAAGNAIGDERVAAGVIEELRVLATLGADASAVALPADHRLRAVCLAFLAAPGTTASIDDWGARFGMSGKTLARMFRSEMQTTFGAWQRSARTELAKQRLLNGESVTRVALELGYESLSAFTAMFRRTTGTLPSRIARPSTGSG